MKYMGSLYAVDDKERTIAFYKEVCGLRMIQDFGRFCKAVKQSNGYQTASSCKGA